MRLNTFGLAVLAALVATAIVGASSASASFNSVLCKSPETQCANENKLENETFHMSSPGGPPETVFTLWMPTLELNLLCLSVLALGEGLELAEAPEPYEIELTKLDFGYCGTDATHINCKVYILEESLPLSLGLLTTKLEDETGTGEGTITVQEGELEINCTIGLLGKLGCRIGLAGVNIKAENASEGVFRFEESPVERIGGLCGEGLVITQGTLEPLVKDEEHYEGPLWVSS